MTDQSDIELARKIVNAPCSSIHDRALQQVGLIAAEIETAREEGRRAGLMEAAQIAWAHRERWKNAGGFHNFASAAMTIADAIEAKAKEAGR